MLVGKGELLEMQRVGSAEPAVEIEAAGVGGELGGAASAAAREALGMMLLEAQRGDRVIRGSRDSTDSSVAARADLR